MKRVLLFLIVFQVAFCQTAEEEIIVAKYIKNILQFKKYVGVSSQMKLMKFRNPAVAPFLVECLEMRRRREDNEAVRYWCIVKLGQFKYKKAADILVKVFENEEDDWWIKSAAVEALEKIGYKRVSFYLKVLEVDNFMMKKRAVMALQKIAKKKKSIAMTSSRAKVLKAIKFWKKWGKKQKKK